MPKELFGEWMPDQTDLDNPGAKNAKNVRPAGVKNNVHYLPLESFVDVSSAVVDEAIGGITVRDEDNNVYTYIGTRTKIYQQAATPTDVSRTTPADYQTQAEDRWEFIEWNDRVIGVNGVDGTAPANTMQTIVKGGANFADVVASAGTLPRAKHIGVIGNFVVVGNIYNGTTHLPATIAWSGFNDYTKWDYGTDQSDTQNIPDGGWVQAVVGGQREGVIFLERSIIRLTYVGVPLVFDPVEIEKERGTPAPGSVVQYGRNIYYLGQDGFYVLRDKSESIPIGEEKVNRWFFERADADKYFKMSSTIDPINNLVIWLFQSDAAIGDTPDMLLIYHWMLNRWSYAETNAELIMLASALGYTLEGLDAAFGSNLDELPASLDSALYKGGKSLILSGVDSAHKFGHFTGDFMTAVLETKEIGKSFRYHMDSFLDLTEGQAGTSSVKIKHRNTRKEALSETAAMVPNANGRLRSRKNARYQSIELTRSGGFEHAPGFEIEEIRRGGNR